jgi:branched-chain amino acid aminotransferase
MMSGKVFLNDGLIEADDAHLSVSDSGFLYGAGLFETMRCRNGVVFRLQDHLDRLFASATALSIVHPYKKEYITESVYAVLDANELVDARLRLTLTGGPPTGPAEDGTPTLLITATTFQPYPDEYYRAGVTVVLCPFRQSGAEPTCGHKTTSYFSRLLALNLAHHKRAAEALWFTTDNRLAEGCVSNVFLVKDAVLYTPPIETPVLPGIARKTVAESARQASIELVEKDLVIADVLEAQEAFLTNVIMEILPVVRVEKHTVGTGEVGPTTKKLRERFQQTVEQRCRERT